MEKLATLTEELRRDHVGRGRGGREQHREARQGRVRRRPQRELIACLLAGLPAGLPVGGCSGDDRPEPPRTPPAVTFSFAQWLPDEGTDRALLRVTNDSEEPPPVTGAGLRWSGYGDFVDPQDSTLDPGQTLDLRVVLPAGRCSEGQEPIAGVVATPSGDDPEPLPGLQPDARDHGHDARGSSSRAVAQIYGTAVATDFPTRAEAIADTIAAEDPDLIGLQEVTRWIAQPTVAGPNPPSFDFLAILQDELYERGLDYCVAAVSDNADIGPGPAGGAGVRLRTPTTAVPDCVVTLQDRDVILVNDDTPRLRVLRSASGDYTRRRSSTLRAASRSRSAAAGRTSTRSTRAGSSGSSTPTSRWRTSPPPRRHRAASSSPDRRAPAGR